jgi:PAS domain S-box-containing protein
LLVILPLKILFSFTLYLLMMKSRTTSALIIILVLTFTSILITIFIYNGQIQNSETTAKWVAHTHEVLYLTEQVLTLVIDSETGARGYLLTGKDEFSEPLLKSAATIDDKLERLKKLTAENPNQQPRMDSLMNFIRLRLEAANRLVELRQQEGIKAIPLSDLGIGKSYTDKIRIVIDQIINEEERLHQFRVEANRQSQESLTHSLFILVASVLITLVFVVVLLGFNISSINNSAKIIEEKERLVQTVINQNDAGISVRDLEGRFELANAFYSSWLGKTRLEILGKTLKELHPSELANQTQAIIKDVIQSNAMKEHDIKVMINDDEQIHHAKFFPITNAAKKVIAVGTLSSNITKLKKLETELRLQNESLEATVLHKTRDITNLFDRITDAFIALDLDWNFTYVNKRAGEIFGQDPRYLIGKNFWTERPNAINSPFEEAFRKSMKEQKTLHLNEYHKPRDSYYETHIYPSPNGLSIFFRDITEQKKAEEKIAQMQSLMSLLVENAPAAVAMFDKDMRYLVVSKRYLRDYRLNGIDVIGQSHYDVFPEMPQRWRDIHRRTLAGATEKSEEEDFYRLDGSVDIIRWEILPWYKSASEIGGIILFSEDIRERKNAEKIVKRSEELFSFIFKVAPSSMMLFALPDLRTVEVNDNFVTVTGYTRAEAIGKTTMELDMWADLAQRERFLALLSDHGSVKDLEAILKNKSGNLRTGLVSAFIITIQEKKYLLASFNDITERKIAEDEIMQTAEQLRLYSAGLQNIREEERIKIAREIHDELGQQLTGLRMDVAWLDKKIGNDNEAVHKRIKEMSPLIDKTINTVRRISSDLRPGILDDLGLDAALEWQSSEFEKRFGIKVKFHCIILPLKIKKAIATGLFRIYQEALTNVARHSQATEVNAGLIVNENRITLTIADNGIGMDLNKREGRETLGIIGMKERVIMIGGEFQIISSFGNGTTVLVKVPV